MSVFRMGFKDLTFKMVFKTHLEAYTYYLLRPRQHTSQTFKIHPKLCQVPGTKTQMKRMREDASNTNSSILPVNSLLKTNANCSGRSRRLHTLGKQVREPPQPAQLRRRPYAALAVITTAFQRLINVPKSCVKPSFRTGLWLELANAQP